MYFEIYISLFKYFVLFKKCEIHKISSWVTSHMWPTGHGFGTTGMAYIRRAQFFSNLEPQFILLLIVYVEIRIRCGVLFSGLVNIVFCDIHLKKAVILKL